MIEFMFSGIDIRRNFVSQKKIEFESSTDNEILSRNNVCTGDVLT